MLTFLFYLIKQRRMLNLQLILCFLILGLNSSTKYSDVISALQEVAYSYYMRGKYIQYNINKAYYFPPEEATSQNIKYLVCSKFTKSVYYELLNITIPRLTTSHHKYSNEHFDCPEVVAYSRPVKNRYELVFKKSEKEIVITSIKDVIKYLKVGDILTVDGHTVLLYKTINESEAIYIESAHGIGKDVVNTKINKNGNHNLYLNEKINPDFKENITQGSVGICYLSTYTKWININNTLNYTILRFIHENKAGNAILKYKTPLFDEDKAKI